MSSLPADADMLDPASSPTFAAGDRGACKGLLSPLMRKRARSPMHLKVQELQRGGCEDPDLEIRSQKRYMTEMIAADLSKLRMDQQHAAGAPTASRSRPTFTLPPIRLPPSPRPPTTTQVSNGSGRLLTDYMECDDCNTTADSSSNGGGADFTISAYVPAAAAHSSCCPTGGSGGVNSQPNATPTGPSAASAEPGGRSMSCPSLQQLQREAHESPSSPTDNKLSIDLRKAALIRSLLHKSYCDPAGRCVVPLPPQLEQQQQQQQEECSSAQRSTAGHTPADGAALAPAIATVAAAATPLPAAGPLPSTAPAPATDAVAMEVSPQAADAALAAALEPLAGSTLQLTPPSTRTQPPNSLASQRTRAVHSDS